GEPSAFKLVLDIQGPLGGTTLAKLTTEQIVTIQVLHERGESQRESARILGVSEGAVRYHLRRAREGAADGRQKPARIEQLGLAEAVVHWWQAQVENLGQQRPPSVQLLHEFLRAEYGYNGSYKSVRKFVRARYGRAPTRPLLAGPIRPAPDPPVPPRRDPTWGPDTKRLGRVPPRRPRRPGGADHRLRL